ncbi:MAG: helix-turn-helix domain-containing protein [Allomuricauda sp.]
MYILKQLRRKKNISQTDLAHEIGVSLRTVQLYERKNANIPIKNLTKIADYFEMTIAELYLHEVHDIGEGYIRKQPFTKHGSVFYPLDHGKYLIMAPLVLMEHYDGYIEKLKERDIAKNPFQAGFVIDHLEDRTYAAFEITGDSMDDHSLDAVPNKAIVLGSELSKNVVAKGSDDLWNKPYVLVCKDRIICKQLTGLNDGKRTIHCHNLNTSPEYQDFELSLEEILQVFRIVKKQL